MLLNMPTVVSSSGSGRPAMGVPTAKSVWPLYLASSACHAASSVMNRVAPCSLASAAIGSMRSASSSTRCTPPSSACAGGRARSVGSSSAGTPVRTLLPVRHVPVEFGAGQALALPGREIAVAQRGVGRHRLPRDPGPVRRKNIADDDVDRPAVADDVMRQEGQYVPLGGVPDQQRSHQRTGGEVERLGRGQAGDLHRAVLIGRLGEIELEPRLGRDDDGRLAVVGGGEPHPQALMARHHIGQRRTQSRGVERTSQFHGQRHVVRR